MKVLVAYDYRYRFYREVIARGIGNHRPHLQVLTPDWKSSTENWCFSIRARSSAANPPASTLAAGLCGWSCLWSRHLWL